jgi:hypothetical protein
MPDNYGTPEMFEVPERYRAPKRQQKGVVWRRHTGKQTSCDDCVMALARGEVKFAPTLASHLRSTPEGRHYFCSEHTLLRKEDDKRSRVWNG